MPHREETYEQQRAKYKFFVVDVNKVCIASGWEYREDALTEAKAAHDEGRGPVKVMTKPAVGGQKLDPLDPASWRPRRNGPEENPIRLSVRFVCPGCGARGPSPIQHRVGCRLADPVRRPRRNPGSSDNEFGARLAVLRRRAGLSQQELGARAEVGADTISRLEAGLQGVRAGTLRRLAEALGVPNVVLTSGAARVTEGTIPIREDIQMRWRVEDEARENPGELMVVNDGGEHDSARAEGVYAMWHKREPRSTAVIRPGCDENDVMLCVGNAFDIVYCSNKWERDTRKTNSYIHVFDSKPRVYMLAHLADKFADNSPRDNPGKTVGSLLNRVRNRDGQFAVAELARPESFSLDNGTDEGDEVAIHSGGKVYGAVDKKTVIIMDPVWKLIVVRGGKMHFDERGIVK